MIQKNQISNNLWNSKTYFMYQKQDSMGINQKRFRVKVYPDALFLQLLNCKIFPAGKDYIR